MGSFLLNDRGEVLLEINDKIPGGDNLCLKINEKFNDALLVDENQKIQIGYVHPEVLLFLKQNRYLFIVEHTNQFYAFNSRLANVIFVD
jgi:hypothetical protein